MRWSRPATNRAASTTTSAISASPRPTSREKVTLYELGSKNVFYLGGMRTRLNGSLFYNDYKDQVLTSLLSVAQAIDLIGSPRTCTLAAEHQRRAGRVVQLQCGEFEDLRRQHRRRVRSAAQHQPRLQSRSGSKPRSSRPQPIQDFRYQADVAPTDAVFRSIDGKRLPRTPRFQMNATLGTDRSTSVRATSTTSCRPAIARSSYMTIFNGGGFHPGDGRKAARRQGRRLLDLRRRRRLQPWPRRQAADRGLHQQSDRRGA